MFYRQPTMRNIILASAALALPTLAPAQFVGRNFSGSTLFTDSGSIPPDTMGAAGPEHYVELLNGRYSVYRKRDGTRVQTSSLNSFWSSAGVAFTNSTFDPRVVYDHASRRWFAAAVDNARGPNGILLAVSDGADPTLGWQGLRVDSDPTDVRWADFPMMGLNADGVYIAANMFGISGAGADISIWSFPKADLVGATPSAANRSEFLLANAGFRGFSPHPAIDYGASDGRGVLLSALSGTQRARSDVLGSDAGGATLAPVTYLATASILNPPRGRQPDGTRDLEAGDSRFSSAPFRVGDDLWAVHTVAASGAGTNAALRWYRIDVPSNTVVETGVILEVGRDLYYPSIAANGDGDVVIGYSRSGIGADEFISAYAVLGTRDGSSTTFGAPTLLQAGVDNYFQDFGSGRNRWGDYSSVSPDPADPGIFWTSQLFANSGDRWTTQISELIVPRDDERRWQNPGGGTWSDASRWFGGAAPTPAQHAIFSRSTSNAYVVSLDADATVGTLSIRQGRPTLALGSLTLAAGALRVNEFDGVVNAAIQGGTLLIGGAATVDHGATLTLSGTRATFGSIAVDSGRMIADVGAASVLRTGALAVQAGAIDVGSSLLLIDYSGESPLGTPGSGGVAGLIALGFNGGAWDGEGIVSSLAGATVGVGYAEAAEILGLVEGATAEFRGETVDATTVLVVATLLGDANLDGAVDVSDLGRLASGWQSAGRWDDGDLTYDGLVDVADLGLLATNWQAGVTGPFSGEALSWTAALTSVPEPGAGAVALLLASCAGRRKRRGQA